MLRFFLLLAVGPQSFRNSNTFLFLFADDSERTFSECLSPHSLSHIRRTAWEITADCRTNAPPSNSNAKNDGTKEKLRAKMEWLIFISSFQRWRRRWWAQKANAFVIMLVRTRSLRNCYITRSFIGPPAMRHANTSSGRTAQRRQSGKIFGLAFSPSQ